jgi:integrase
LLVLLIWGKPRIIYLTPKVAEILERRMAAAEPGAFLFTGQRGNPWSVQGFHSRFRQLRKVVPGIGDVLPYTIRHSFATEALEKGVPEAAVAELLGHQGTAMLYKHYAHLSKKIDYLREQASRARQ